MLNIFLGFIMRANRSHIKDTHYGLRIVSSYPTDLAARLKYVLETTTGGNNSAVGVDVIVSVDLRGLFV